MCKVQGARSGARVSLRGPMWCTNGWCRRIDIVGRLLMMMIMMTMTMMMMMMMMMVMVMMMIMMMMMIFFSFSG